ncbi:nuclear transport factor 2 family protein [Hymenobacter daeguensis]
MTNEEVIRNLYAVAELQDPKQFRDLFTEDGYFYDVSAGQKYYGDEIGRPVEIYATAFPDMHRELYDLYVAGDVITVELSLNGTHNGPLVTSMGSIAATGNEMHAPCCDVFHIENGKVKSFHCYTAATIIFGQLGVLGNLAAALQQQ